METKWVGLVCAAASIFGCGTVASSSSKAASRGQIVQQEPLRPEPSIGKQLPSLFEENRIFVTPMTKSGQTLRFFTDTGGGISLHRSTAEALALPIRSVMANDTMVDGARLPEFAEGQSIPSISILDGNLPIVDTQKGHENLDGVLGQAWFRDRLWTIDYVAKTFMLHAPGANVAPETAERIKLHFQTKPNGERANNYPRIRIRIDGADLDMLLDTGATVLLSDSARTALADGGPQARATSFISKSTFEAWRTTHPDWRVIENADTSVEGEPMIEVPEVGLGNITVGPVWFTRRADSNFHDWMSQWMDKEIDGALGGSALQYLRITLDYPQAEALLEPVETQSQAGL